MPPPSFNQTFKVLSAALRAQADVLDALDALQAAVMASPLPRPAPRTAAGILGAVQPPAPAPAPAAEAPTPTVAELIAAMQAHAAAKRDAGGAVATIKLLRLALGAKGLSFISASDLPPAERAPMMAVLRADVEGS
jgi:hypothetical protein